MVDVAEKEIVDGPVGTVLDGSRRRWTGQKIKVKDSHTYSNLARIGPMILYRLVLMSLAETRSERTAVPPRPVEVPVREASYLGESVQDSLPDEEPCELRGKSSVDTAITDLGVVGE